MDIIEIKFKQHNPYGCGIYAVANALDFSTYITEARLEQSKSGGTIQQLNNWLDEDGHNFHIDTIYYDCNNLLPDNWDVIPLGESDCLPILLKIQGKSLDHMISVHVFNNGELYIHDSLKQQVLKTNWTNLKGFYKEIRGVYAFKSNDPKICDYMIMMPEATVKYYL